jgi:hypothetical protein
MKTFCQTFVWGLAISLVAAVAGCGASKKTFPVAGTVKFADGNALAGGNVEFSSEAVETKGLNARGVIEADGSFKLKTWIDGKDRDGAVPGRHRVAVIPPPLDRPLNMQEEFPASPVNDRFRSYEKSGLEFTVKAGERNHFDIIVSP